MTIVKNISAIGIDVMDNLFEQQKLRQKELLAKLEQEKPTPENPLIILNPWQTAPLSALIAFETSYEAQYLVEILGKTENANLSYMLPSGKKHLCHVWGLYPDYENTVRLTDKAGKELIFTIQTPPLSDAHPKANHEGNAPYNTLRMMTFADNRFLPTGYDVNGDIRWAFSLPLAHEIQRSLDGYLWVGGADQLTPPYGSTSIWKITLDGRILEVHRPQGGLAGHLVELPDHTLVFPSQEPGLTTVMDEIVWYSPTEQKEIRRIRLKDFFLPTVKGTSARCGTDWIHARQIHYNDFDGTIWVLLSYLNRILVFDAVTGKLLKFYGSEEAIKAIDFTYVNHTKKSLPFVVQDALPYKEGFITYSMEEPNTLTSFSPNLTPYAEVQLPPVKGSPVLSHLAYTNDEALSLLLGAGEENQPPGESSLFDAATKEKTFNASYIIFQGDQPASILTLSQAVAAAHLWHASGYRQAPLEKATLIAQDYDPMPALDIPIAVSGKEMIDSDFHLQLKTDHERLFVSGQVFQGEMVLLLLYNKKNALYYYMPTNLKPYGASWLRSRYDGPERDLIFALPLATIPQGHYQVALVVDDIQFETNAQLTIHE